MIPGDCWCSENGKYAAGVWQEVYDVESSGDLKMGERDVWCCEFAGIVFLILSGWCLCLCRAGSEADDKMRELFEEREDR